jgi:isocitrate dehydrogenase
MYFGKEIEMTDDTFIAIRRITRRVYENISRYAFEEDTRRGWDTVVGIHKSNILRMTCGAFMDTLRATATEYPDVELWEYHVDNMAQQLIKNLQLFDHKVLVSTNLFMDILSEQCAGLIGSIGLVYSANLCDDYAMFEPAHGSAPKYKGLDKVDPYATILAGAWMLRYLDAAEEADAIIRDRADNCGGHNYVRSRRKCEHELYDGRNHQKSGVNCPDHKIIYGHIRYYHGVICHERDDMRTCT